MRELCAEGRGKVLAFCWLGWVFDFYDLILFAFVKVQVARDLDLAVEGALAWIDGWTLLATAVGGFGLGRFADRVGRRPALALGIVVFSAGTLATGFAVDFWSLLAARVLTGLGVGGEWGIAHALLAEVYPPALRLRAAALLQAGAPVAMAAAALVGCLAAPIYGWRACFWVSAATAGLALFTRMLVPTAPLRSDRSVSWTALFAVPHRTASRAILLLLALHMTGFWCTYAWLPVTLMRELKVAPDAVAWFQVQVNAVHVVADLSFAWLADRWGRRRVFGALCWLFAAGLAGLAFGFAALAQDWRLFTIATASLGLGAGTWSLFGPLFVANYPPELRATAAGLFYNLARSVQLVVQPLVGALALAAGTLTVGLWFGAASAVASIWALGLVPRVGESGDESRT